MLKILKIALAIPSILIVTCHFIPDAKADLLCGLYRINIKENGLQVNDRQYEYVTSTLGNHGDYVHQFEDGNQIRVTQHHRVAYRQLDATRWNACVPLVYYREGKK